LIKPLFLFENVGHCAICSNRRAELAATAWVFWRTAIAATPQHYCCYGSTLRGSTARAWAQQANNALFLLANGFTQMPADVIKCAVFLIKTDLPNVFALRSGGRVG
jgi:hypothetical protein